MVYSGPFSRCQEYFDHIGHPCPPGFNIADYLVDLTMHASRTTASSNDSSSAAPSENDAEAAPQSPLRARPRRKNSIREVQEHQLYDPRPRQRTSTPSLQDEFGTTQQWASVVADASLLQRDSGQNSGRATPSRKSKQRVPEQHAQEHLESLVYSYQNSAIYNEIREEIDDAVNATDEDDGLPSGEELSRNKRIGWIMQFYILSRRTFKNLYRNPMLMLTHYTIAILMARKSQSLNGFDMV